MSAVLASIIDIGKGKALVVIDGVGDPAVGSVVGVSNVDVATALPCSVIFVGKPGIGAAIDNTVLCVSFMQSKGVKNIGLIYNQIPTDQIFEARKYVSKRIPELLPNVILLGFTGKEDKIFADPNDTAIARWFSDSVDEKTLLQDWLGLKKTRRKEIEP
jgi:dethiobiotin synthetase